MKHLIGLMLALVMLTGCAAGAAPAETTVLTTAPVTTAIPEGTEPSAALESTYVSDSAMERQTDGAVRMYCPDIGEYTELVVWGDNLLVLSGEEQTTLTLLECDTLAIGARIKLDCRIYAANGGVQVGKDGITYFCDAQAALFPYYTIRLMIESSFLLHTKYSLEKPILQYESRCCNKVYPLT